MKALCIVLLILTAVVATLGLGCEGPQGLPGPTGEAGPAGDHGPEGHPGSSWNPLQIALLRWYEANGIGHTFSVGSKPEAVCFDGANVWVANSGSDNVTKLKASDGSFVDNYSVGSRPEGVCFDGAHIWVANSGDGNVTKL